MIIWDGNRNDLTEQKGDKCLQINSCGVQRMSAGWTTVRDRGRQDFHLLLVESGTFEVFHNGRTQTLTRGGFVIYRPGERQRYTTKTDGVSLWLHFGGWTADAFLREFSLGGSIYEAPFSMAAFESYLTMIRRFNQLGLEKLAVSSLLALLAHLSDAVHVASPTQESERITEILTYINTNYNKNLDIDALAKRAGYSKSRFSHLFSEIMHISPLAYLNGIRLTNACELLSGTENTVGEIAHSCGFRDPLYFCRVFKSKYGLSPSDYRKRRRPCRATSERQDSEAMQSSE